MRVRTQVSKYVMRSQWIHFCDYLSDKDATVASNQHIFVVMLPNSGVETARY